MKFQPQVPGSPPRARRFRGQPNVWCRRHVQIAHTNIVSSIGLVSIICLTSEKQAIYWDTYRIAAGASFALAFTSSISLYHTLTVPLERLIRNSIFGRKSRTA